MGNRMLRLIKPALRTRSALVYAAAFVLVLASWAGNLTYDRMHRLPEGRFLKHYIEVREEPSFPFDLLYVANRNDKRKPVNATIAELPSIRFYPVTVHMELSHQTIYKLMGHFADSGDADRPAAEPLHVRRATVHYSDGTVKEEEIGDIVVYRDKRPEAANASPFGGASSSGSSDHSGSMTFDMKRPAILTQVGSAWLKELGADFQYDLSSSGGTVSALPLKLEKGRTMTVRYRYRIPEGSPKAMNVYHLLLTELYEEEDGKRWTQDTFANFDPYPTEAEMRAFVREARKEESR